MRTLPLLLALALPLLRSSAASPVEVASNEMVQAADHWLSALTPEQKARATFELKEDERLNWHFIPRDRKGLSVKEMTPAQRHLAQALLASALSQRGFIKAATIMSLESILKDIEQGTGPVRDPEFYYFSVFGKPTTTGNWGWRVEGHHLSLNFTLTGGRAVSVTPSFLGSNPGEVRSGPRQGLRVLAAEEDLARQLVKSLDASQSSIAILSNTAPKDVITSADRKARELTPPGLVAAKMAESQRGLLERVILEYVGRYRGELAAQDIEKIRRAGLDKVSFAWAGGTEPGQGHYYRIQGPTFLLEYNNTQNDANHIHAVWRDFNGDFGEDLLKQHYEQTPHPQ